MTIQARAPERRQQQTGEAGMLFQNRQRSIFGDRVAGYDDFLPPPPSLATMQARMSSGFNWSLGDHVPARTEAAFQPESEDDQVKKENGLVGAAVGAIGGGLVGAGIGALVGGPIGAAIGAGVGVVAGGIAGALIGSAMSNVGITWPAAGYRTGAANAASTTTERPFRPAYRAVADPDNNKWNLKVDSITGGADILVNTGGSRNPDTNPPRTEAEAKDAVNVMKAYYNNGYRGAWHTEAASKAHELYHYREWKCSSEYYWPATLKALESLSVPYKAHANAASALTALRAGASGADAKLAAFTRAARTYWFTLGDGAKDRPYAAGQLELNNSIKRVQQLAKSKGWTVAQGVNRPSTAKPCYQPYPKLALP